MANAALQQTSVNRLAAEADAVGRLAQDGGAFAAAVAAFEAKDPEAFRWVLQRLELLPNCELICAWIQVKLCGLRCFELCGPPVPTVAVPELPAFARAIIQLASNETVLRQVVDAVSCGDANAYQAAIAEAKLQDFCNLICRYVCSVIYRRICEIVCTPLTVAQAADPALDIQADAEALRRVVANERLVAVIGSAVVGLDCEPLLAAIGETGFAGDCEVICRWICVWRCVWVCALFCPEAPPILARAHAVDEARKFALAARGLAGQPRALADLVAAVANRNAQAYSALIGQLGLGPYCWQACSWVCAEVCHEFCICICPPVLFPWFTAIGGYDYLAQIDSALPATGLTYGDTRAFFSTLRLNGVLTQTLSGQPLEYRFEFQPITVVTTQLAAPITTTAQNSISVVNGAPFPATPFNAVIGTSNGGYEIVTVNSGPPGNSWNVTRGQKGTAPATAATGATITTGAAAAGGWTPVPDNWIAPTKIGILEFGLPPFPEFWVGTPGSPPPPPPVIPVNVVGGWIQAPQGPNVFLNGDMINLISPLLPSFLPAADETGVTAGNPAKHPLTTDRCFGLRMRVRQQGKPATETDGGTCAVVAVDNTLYDNINQHPDWDGGVVSGQFATFMVDIKELQGNGCADITNSLTVLFTASHPNLGAVGVQMIGPGGPYPFTLPTPIPETGDWYGVAAPNGWSLANLKPCAYIVQLSVDLLLTNGDQDFGPPRIDQIAFCLSGTKPGP